MVAGSPRRAASSAARTAGSPRRRLTSVGVCDAMELGSTVNAVSAKKKKQGRIWSAFARQETTTLVQSLETRSNAYESLIGVRPESDTCGGQPFIDRFQNLRIYSYLSRATFPTLAKLSGTSFASSGSRRIKL